MAESVIIVQRKGGGYVKDAKVSLEFSGFFSGGFTKSYYTDSYGKAVIEHSSTGQATIWVNGKKAGRINAPDREVVFI